MNDVTQKRVGKGTFPVLDLDAYSQEEVANRVLKVGVKKVRFPFFVTLALGIFGGSFISLGVLYQLIVMANPAISDSASALLAPFFFAMGYIMAYTTGAEVFTTSNLAVMSVTSGRVTLLELARNWLIVLFANAIGAIAIAILFLYSGLLTLFDGALVTEILRYDSAKLNYSAMQMLIQGLFGNLIICAGVWLAMAGRTVTDKFLVLLLPMSAVPAMGFQHCTGNMFHLFLSMIILPEAPGLELYTEVTMAKTALNLVMVGLGNIIGGGVLIALVHYFVYVRSKWS